jgi:HAD superfamily hydrolase (TIGR01509 family)
MKVWEDVDRIFLEENAIYNVTSVSDVVKKMTLEESAQYFIDRFELSYTTEYVINRIEEIVAEQYAKNIQLKPYAEEFLDWLDKNNIPFCIATATYASLAEAALRRLGILERFRFVLTCSDIGIGKTSPKVYLHAAEKLGFMPCETAVIEDAFHCIQTAKNAGFYVIGVFDKTSQADWPQIKEISDKTISSFSELII